MSLSLLYYIRDEISLGVIFWISKWYNSTLVEPSKVDSVAVALRARKTI